jgi:hypothetical protein
MPEYASQVDFVSCNPEDSSVVAFGTTHPTSHSIHDCMMARTSALYDSITTMFCLWLPATIVWLLAQDKLEHRPAEDD